MKDAVETASQVKGTVTEVYPVLGLAYATCEDNHHWTITKSTQGPGFGVLLPGKRVGLMIEHHPLFSLVREYAALD
jgi:hypothetical protein